MKGPKLEQAKGALRSALDSLDGDDRFALIQFATVVNPFRDDLKDASRSNLAEARAWVDALQAQGATDIGSAVEEALRFRPHRDRDDGRSFQVVFFTDGLPTAGRDSDAILKLVEKRDLGSVRLFTFGVGDDVDTHLLDRLAESTRAASSYVRPEEDIEAKASALVAKISHPVRTDLRLKAGGGVRLVEVYPPRLPDLFRGEQLQIAGRYEGSGHVAMTLSSRVGDRDLTDTYEVRFPDREPDHDFVPAIWARRKVGYLLDQVRLHGESGELKEEVIRLAREFGIATPYTSLLVVPDERPGLAQRPRDRFDRPRPPFIPGAGSASATPASPPGGGFGGTSEILAERSDSVGLSRQAGNAKAKSGLGQQGQGQSGPVLSAGGSDLGMPGILTRNVRREQAATVSAEPVAGAPVSGKAAIEMAKRLADLKTQGRIDSAPTVRVVDGHRFREVEGAWIDERFDASAETLALRPFGPAYFRILERHPELKDVLSLGDRLVWVSPSGKALVIDAEGADEIPDARLDALFAKAGNP